MQQIAITTHQVDAINDTKTKIQVIGNFRSTGIDAYPNVPGSHFISTNGLTNSQSVENIYSLGAIANKTSEYCNESGEWTVFKSDEHEFNNLKGSYVKDNADFMLTGDSFAEGACVNPNESIAAILRELGMNVISLGKGGNGSLLEFTLFKEYAEPLRPKIVWWVHYANDIDDLILKSMQSPFLKNYLADKYLSRDIFSRQDENDVVLRTHINREYREHKREIEQNNITKGKKGKWGKATKMTAKR